MLAVVLVALTGCTAATGAPTTAGPTPPPVPARPTAFYAVPVPLDAEPPGSVIRAAIVRTTGSLPVGTTVERVLYHSESAGGGDVAVSGLVVIPAGPPPRGGFPIVAWAHGTAGLAPKCAPSVTGAGTVPYLDALVHDRMIVAATDYQGLGTPDGTSPYLVGASEAQDVLDAVRAARQLAGAAASNTVVLLGHSQGGQAALFAAQLAPEYAPELFVAGVVAAAPVTSVLEFAPSTHSHPEGPAGPAGPVGPAGPAGPGAGYLLMAFDAWASVYGNLSLGSLVATTTLDRMGIVGGQCDATVEAVFDGETATTLFAGAWRTYGPLLADVSQNVPGGTPISSPVLVVQGTADGIVPYASTTAFVAQRLCAAEDDTVEYLSVRRAGHDDILAAATSPIVAWITQRLEGMRAPTTCASDSRRS